MSEAVREVWRKIANRTIRRPDSLSFWAFWAVAIIGCVWFVASVLGVEGHSADGTYIELESVIELPSASTSVAWGADSKKLLVSLPYGLPGTFPIGRIRAATLLVDAKTRAITNLNATLDNALDDIFWSPNGNYVATARGRYVLLYAYPSLRVAARLEAEPRSSENWCSFKTREAVQFTSDSRYLWVACNLSSEKPDPRLLLAVKLSVPDLRVVDRLFLPNPEPTKRVSDRQYIVRQGNAVVLSSVLQMHGEKMQGFQYVACFLLEEKMPCFPPFQINELSIGGGVIHAPAYSVEKKLGAVTTIGPIYKLDGTKYEKRPVKLTLFRETAKRPVSIFEPGIKNKLTWVGSPTFSKSGKYLIAAASLEKKTLPFRSRSVLGIWQVDNLELVQVIPTPSSPSRFFSPDRSRLAIIEENRIHIYRISESPISEGAR